MFHFVRCENVCDVKISFVAANQLEPLDNRSDSCKAWGDQAAGHLLAVFGWLLLILGGLWMAAVHSSWVLDQYHSFLVASGWLLSIPSAHALKLWSHVSALTAIESGRIRETAGAGNLEDGNALPQLSTLGKVPLGRARVLRGPGRSS